LWPISKASLAFFERLSVPISYNNHIAQFFSRFIVNRDSYYLSQIAVGKM
jgi:hypothetical protein